MEMDQQQKPAYPFARGTQKKTEHNRTASKLQPYQQTKSNWFLNSLTVRLESSWGCGGGGGIFLPDSDPQNLFLGGEKAAVVAE